MALCNCGCGKMVKEGRKFIHGHNQKGRKPWNKDLTKETDDRVRRYVELGSITKKGQVPWNKNKTGVYSEKTIKKMVESSKGKIPWNKDKKGVYSEETIKKLVESHIGIPGYWKDKKREAFSKQWRENISKNGKGKTKEGTSKWMKENGSKIRKLIKNPSRPELNLRPIVKESSIGLFGENVRVEYTFSILNYEVDNAIVEHKIAIEYDGYFHFCDQEHIDYHNKRQKEIEQEGWRFLRYNIYQKFPTLEQVKEDINKLLNKE